MKDRDTKAQFQTDIILRMESQLRNGFNPVQPNPEFVQRLRNRLTHPPEVFLEERSRLPVILVTLGLITAGIIVLWVINKVRSMIFR